MIDGLKFQTNFAYAFDLNATKSYNPKSPARYDAEGNVKKVEGATNQSSDYWYRNATWTNENLLTYNKQFNEHNISVLLGHSIIGSRYYTTTAAIQGFPTEISMNSMVVQLIRVPKEIRKNINYNLSSAV